MSLIKDIHSYWRTNNDINAAFGDDSLFFTVQPDNTPKPYAVLECGESKVVLENTGLSYAEELPFTVIIICDAFPQVDDLAEVVMGAFDRRKFADSVIVNRRGYYHLSRSESGIYTAIISYNAQYQRSFLPDA
jgi:hypothetical protein